MSKDNNCKWYFCEDPDGFSFGAGVAPQKNFRKASIAASIVRESLQNSIDAAVDYPVRVSYSRKELVIGDYPSLFGLEECADGISLCDHFSGIVKSFNENDEENIQEYEQKAQYVLQLKNMANLNDTVPYLRISDYNTSGMNYSEKENKGTFASFVRSAGRNDKNSKGSAGSCGVGKGAYLQMSKINTLIVSSRSKDQTLFEGYMLSVSHYVNGKGYHPYAFYDSNNRKPVSDENIIPREFLRDEIGTDINIIGIDDSNWKQQVSDMVVAVLKNFWLAIYEKKLIVEIEDIKINRDNLPDLLQEYFGDKKDGAQERTYNPFVYYRIVASEENDKIKHIKATLPLLGDVEFHLNKAKTGNGRILYMRESRMLIFSRVENMYNQINGVFVCTGKEGNEILKKAENEAHNEWKAKQGDQKAIDAINAVFDFIRKCLEEELGSVTKTTVDIKSLAKRLPISTEPIFDEDYNEDFDLDEEGQSITETAETTDANLIQAHKEKKVSAGKVRVRKKNVITPDPTGDIFDITLDGENPEIPSNFEPRDNPGPNPGPHPGPNPGPNPGPDPDDTTSPTTTSQETQEGKTKKAYTLQSFEPYSTARKVNGDWIYEARIRCTKEHENANLEITIDGEAGDDHLDIIESSLGNPEGHIIKNVHLIKGVTNLFFKFKENEKVSVRISAYEYKD